MGLKEQIEMTMFKIMTRQNFTLLGETKRYVNYLTLCYLPHFSYQNNFEQSYTPKKKIKTRYYVLVTLIFYLWSLEKVRLSPYASDRRQIKKMNKQLQHLWQRNSVEQSNLLSQKISRSTSQWEKIGYRHQLEKKKILEDTPNKFPQFVKALQTFSKQYQQVIKSLKKQNPNIIDQKTNEQIKQNLNIIDQKTNEQIK